MASCRVCGTSADETMLTVAQRVLDNQQRRAMEFQRHLDEMQSAYERYRLPDLETMMALLSSSSSSSAKKDA
jgi:hypothetical protein